MKQRPILFSGPMVRAILDGRKTQTRRPFRYQPSVGEDGDFMELGFSTSDGNVWFWEAEHPEEGSMHLRCPFGDPGDRLWVRETWNADWGDPGTILYRADGGSAVAAGYAREPRWRPSIHMPRWACRLELEITGVRAERLQNITDQEALAEGAEPMNHIGPDQRIAADIFDRTQGAHPYTVAFASLWDGINFDRGLGWAKNPWVWVIDFKITEAIHSGKIRETASPSLKVTGPYV